MKLVKIHQTFHIIYVLASIWGYHIISYNILLYIYIISNCDFTARAWRPCCVPARTLQLPNLCLGSAKMREHQTWHWFFLWEITIWYGIPDMVNIQKTMERSTILSGKTQYFHGIYNLLVLNVGNEGMIHWLTINNNPSNPHSHPHLSPPRWYLGLAG